MPEAVNGVRLYYALHGSGEPLALVRGAWADATAWRFVVPGLAERFRVLSYDRRRPLAQRAAGDAGKRRRRRRRPRGPAGGARPGAAHVVTNSGGGNIALRLATRRPDLFRSLSCHEPALWGLLEEDPESKEILREGSGSVDAVGRRIAEGHHEGAARQFVEEVAFGPGAWNNELLPAARAICVKHAPTFLDELRGPNPVTIEEQAISRLQVPVRLTDGSESRRSSRA
jgi:pimeloyl-ACP methyl ester carboxylesterase